MRGEWADKPRWSAAWEPAVPHPCDKARFSMSGRFRFERPQTGKAIGAPFQLTHFDSPGFRSRPDFAYSGPVGFHPRGSLSERLWRPAGTSGCLITWTADDLNNVRWVSHCRDLVQLPVAA